MASKTLLQLTQEAPSASDLLYFVKNPGGTPLDRSASLTQIAATLAPILTNVGVNQVAYGASANTLGGDAGFTFDPAADLFTIGTLATRAVYASPLDKSTVALGVSIYETTEQFTVKGLDIYVATDAGAMATTNLVRALNVSAEADSGMQIQELTNINIIPLYFGGTVDAQYGIKIGDVAGATLNRSILTGAGIAEFGDSILVGGDSGGKTAKTGFTNAVNTTLTNALVVKGPQAATTPNDGLMKCYIGTQAVLVPYWNAP